MKDSASAIFLFDVDGVLVDPRAYKIGVSKTLEFLLQEISDKEVSELLPDDAEFAYMESRGIHDVWDMCNIMFALFLKQAFTLAADCLLQSNNSNSNTLQLLHAIRARGLQLTRPDYQGFAEQITQNLSHPPDAALELLTSNLPEQDSEIWLKLFNSFLKGTRSVYESYGTMVFQNIILGSDVFESTYKFESICSAKSLIQTEDRVLLDSSMAAKIVSLNHSHRVKAAVYTARPSLPPPDILDRKGFSPEAEMAAEAAGLKTLPLVGMGMMEWLATQKKERTEDLTKPNRTHSLAALLASIQQSGNSKTLEFAYDYDKNKSPECHARFKALFPNNVTVVVFEDTSSGIKPMLSLAKLLQDEGCAMQLMPLGIAYASSKKQALEPICEKVFDDINQALEYAFAKLCL